MSPSSRMPRAQRRAQLLEVSSRCFIADGYRATSMEHIARAAGVTKPVLYQHYSSKEELFIEVVRSVGDRMVLELTSFSDLEQSSRRRTEVGVQRFMEVIAAPDTSLRLFAPSSEIPPSVAAETQRILDRCAVAMTALILASRRVAERDAIMLGRLLTQIARSVAEQLTRTDSSPADDEARDHLASVVARFIEGGLLRFRALDEAGIPPGATQLPLTAVRAAQIREDQADPAR